ncbi:MAG: TonB-dependent receptor, partial [Pseudomonadota bacterium]
YELGIKSSFLDNTLRFNGALFYVDIENLQTTIFDPSITNLFFSDNAANAEVTGLEGDFIWLPAFNDGLTVTGAFSFLDTEITDVLTPTNDVVSGDELAFAPGFQATLRAKYEWNFSDTLRAHVLPNLTYSGTQFTDVVTINRLELDSWLMVGLTAGVTSESWTAELFINNLTDERAEMSGDFVFDTTRIQYSAPRTVGVRVNFGF